MASFSTMILVATICSPLVGGAGAYLSRGQFGLRSASTAAALGFLGAIYLVAANLVAGPVEALLADGSGSIIAGLSAGPVATVLLLLILGVTATVQAFSSRYLSGDSRVGRFHFLCGLAASALAAAACAATMSGLVVAWCIGGIAACLLLAQRADLHEARVGVQRTASAFAIGDGCLIAALGLVLLTGGDIDLRDASSAAAELSTRQLDIALLGQVQVGVVVAILVGVCALARSAQLPFHRWLPSTLAAPTPASAMLHAGLVNGAGLLIITLAPVLALAPAVLWALLACGCITALLGTALAAVRSDVKGSLAWSTTGQMGFMVAQSASGSFGAALLHILGHGYYKSTLFLGSGSAVDSQQRKAGEPEQPALGRASSRLAIAALAPGILLAAGGFLAYPVLSESRGSLAALVIAWIALSQATWSWLGTAGKTTRGTRGTAALLLSGASLGYVGLITAVDAYVGKALPTELAAWPSPWILVAAVTAGALAALLLSRQSSALVKRASVALWAWAHSYADTTPLAKPISVERPATAETGISQTREQAIPIGAAQ